MPRKGKRAQLAVYVLLLMGVGLLLKAGYVEAKATLAQALLQRAWTRAQSGDGRARPWPWADTWPVARLTTPAQGRSFIVLEGASGQATAFAPAHLRGSAAPGTEGNVAIAAHRDTHFEFLRHLRPGDSLQLESATGQTQSYRVRGTRIVHRTDTSVLAHDRDQLTLITCYPFDAITPGGPLRFIVEADRTS